MASLIRRPRSPFWYIQHRDLTTGKWIRIATKYRIGIGTDTRKAREAAAEYTVKENQAAVIGPNERWELWVDEWISSMKISKKSIDRYRSSWENVFAFFKRQEIPAPRYVSYETCMNFLAWRKKHAVGRKKTPACHNTALLELKVLGFVMGEAVRRNYAIANPCRELRISREKPREKPELTDKQIATIRDALRFEEEWMSDAFELAIHHGCRISECRVAMSDVDLMRGVLFFRNMKGDKPFSVPIHPGIRPLLERKAAANALYVANVPENDSKPFTLLFKRLGMIGVSFHSTRVSVVSRLARSPGIKPEIAMRYVNHSSELVHRIYQRLRSDDLLGVSDALNIPLSETPDAPPAT